MHKLKSCFKLCCAGLLLISGSCSTLLFGPDEGTENMSDQYQFAAAFLDAFFIFRDDLPSDLYSFDSPEELYYSVNEPWTAFYSKEYARIFYSYLNTSSIQGGIGIWVDSVYNGYLIKDVFADSPGKKAGLHRKDTISAVNGKDIAGLEWEQSVSALISGDVGDSVHLGIIRGDSSLTIGVELGMYTSPSVFVDTLDSTTAYIALMGFLAETNTVGGSAQEFRDALNATSWADYTILDLQGNPGGRIDQCLEITSEFVPSGTPIIHTTQRDLAKSGNDYFGYTHDSTYMASGGGSAVARNMILLADRGSASASEILVSCIKYNRPEVVIMGDTTYGKARMQVLEDAPDSGLARVTCGVLNPPGNDSYDLVGIPPDVVVGKGEDALETAISTIKGIAAKRGKSRPHRILGTQRKQWIPLALVNGKKYDSTR